MEIVSGAAAGVDKLGELFAKRNGLTVKSMPADWDNIDVPGAVIRYRNGKPYNAKAGHDRNEDMARYADGLCAVWDGVSTGTNDMIKRANAHELDMFVYNLKERQ